MARLAWGEQECAKTRPIYLNANENSFLLRTIGMIATTHYSKEQMLERWRECIWAGHVPADLMQDLVLPSLQVRHLEAGQTIWRQGDPALHWMGVLGGAA